MDHRRARAALLARADGAIVGGSWSRRRAAAAFALVSAAVAITAIVLVFLAPRASRFAPAPTSVNGAPPSIATSPVPTGAGTAIDRAATPNATPAPAVATAPAQAEPADAGAPVVPPRVPKTEAASASAPNVAPSAAAMATAPPTSSARAPALAGERFARAMSSFNAGDYGEADRAFVAFVRDFPADSRAEDAMFLVADARARRGDTAGAREAARAYLRRFPSGLRAPAAERLAADPH